MAKLTFVARKKMKRSTFAVPSKREGGKGGYPIPDAAHARNALSRVSQFGSASEKAAVRSKVHERFPAIGKAKTYDQGGVVKAGGPGHWEINGADSKFIPE